MPSESEDWTAVNGSPTIFPLTTTTAAEVEISTASPKISTSLLLVVAGVSSDDLTLFHNSSMLLFEL